LQIAGGVHVLHAIHAGTSIQEDHRKGPAVSDIYVSHRQIFFLSDRNALD
jgi:hypothetical protein